MANNTRDVEERMGIEPLDKLLHERETLVKKAARLLARYGSDKIWDAERKIRLCQIAAKLRAQALLDGKNKVTEAWLDEASHSHEDYAAFVAESVTQKAECLIVQNDIQAITERINRGQSLSRFLAAEVHLIP